MCVFFLILNNFFKIIKKYVTYAYNCRLNQSGRHKSIGVPSYIIITQIKIYAPRIPYFLTFTG